MPKTIIVSTNIGFLTSKTEEEILETDNIIYEAKTEEEASNIIHGQHR